MGKGKYDGSIADSIMFFATRDFGVDLEVGPYFDRDGDTVIPYSWDSLEFEYKTNGFNINIIVAAMIKTISKEKIQGFKYKVDSYNPLRNDAYSIFNEKFGHCNWTIEQTWYRPACDEYILDITLQYKKMEYIHKGSIDVGHTRKIGMFFMENYPEYII